MLDLGASKNLMPLTVMEKLSVQIKIPYKDMYSFYSKRVKCLGMIKEFMVNLAQILVKNLVMEIWSLWGSKIGGVVKLDFSYATIPNFGGEERSLHRESRFTKIVTTNDRFSKIVTTIKGSKNALVDERE